MNSMVNGIDHNIHTWNQNNLMSESLIFIVVDMLLYTQGRTDIDFTESNKPPAVD